MRSGRGGHLPGPHLPHRLTVDSTPRPPSESLRTSGRTRSGRVLVGPGRGGRRWPAGPGVGRDASVAQVSVGVGSPARGQSREWEASHPAGSLGRRAGPIGPSPGRRTRREIRVQTATGRRRPGHPLRARPPPAGADVRAEPGSSRHRSPATARSCVRRSGPDFDSFEFTSDRGRPASPRPPGPRSRPDDLEKPGEDAESNIARSIALRGNCVR
jgi:hypothetical protein